jgi:hypothetical protein
MLDVVHHHAFATTSHQQSGPSSFLRRRPDSNRKPILFIQSATRSATPRWPEQRLLIEEPLFAFTGVIVSISDQAITARSDLGTPSFATRQAYDDYRCHNRKHFSNFGYQTKADSGGRTEIFNNGRREI